MGPDASISIAREIMLDFADMTGLVSARKPPRRYLWTDAFAVCNFLELFRRTHEEKFSGMALRLIDQVHHTLGRHRQDGPRRGWISGLDANEGEFHPTRGGLRIGKQLDERRRDEPPNERLEWERDGQYYHYLTKWMHALNRVSQVTGDPAYNRWAMELAQTAHARFTYVHPGDGRKRMYWKMSIDLSYPLVLAMGQHDPLDGLVTYSELQALATGDFGKSSWPELSTDISDLADICREEKWSTGDPLGIGGLLFDAWRMAQLMIKGGFGTPDLLDSVLDAALLGLESFAADNPLKYRARQRLAFRELGLAIGLKGVGKVQGCIAENPDLFGREGPLQRKVEALMG
ncbi:MAG TPA: hypothetical protein VHN12_11095, partial [Geobacteraceae bacterium]|nr:hypothetical protein [Geobacteraceae bacterium]